MEWCDSIFVASHTYIMREGARSRRACHIVHAPDGLPSASDEGTDLKNVSERPLPTQNASTRPWPSLNGKVKHWVFLADALVMSVILAYSLYVFYTDRISELSSQNTGILRFWPIYLTHWALTLEVVFLWVNVMTATTSPSWLARLLYAIAMPCSLMVVCLYWFVIYKPGHAIGVINVLTHGVNFLGMLVVMFSNHYSHTCMKSVYSISYGLLWIAWSVIFYLTGLTNQHGHAHIYAVINWSKPRPTIGLLSLFLLVIVPIINGVVALMQRWVAYSSREVHRQ